MFIKNGMSREEAAKAAVDAVKTLSVKVGIPPTLVGTRYKKKKICLVWLLLPLQMFVLRAIRVR